MKRLALYAVALTMLFACKEDPMRKARQAHAAENADVAESAFAEVLAADPDNFEAKRLMADVHRFRGDFERAEKELIELWTAKNFDGASELTTKDKITKRHMSEQFEALYLAWLRAIDSKKEPELYEQVAKKGLEKDKANPTFNTALVDYYFAQGDRQIEAGDKQAAAKTFEKVLQLRALKKQRADARSRAKKLRSDIFADTFRKNFEAELPKFTESESWQPATRTFRFKVSESVDRSLNPKNEAHVDKARKIANNAVQKQVAATLTRLGGFESPVPLAGLPKYKVVDEVFKRGKYELAADVTYDQLMSVGFSYSEYLSRQKNEKKAPKLAPKKNETSDN